MPISRIGLIGDNHGHWDFLADACTVLRDAHGCTQVIQVGDCGFALETVDHYHGLRFSLPVYAIDGNHEDHDLHSTTAFHWSMDGTLGKPRYLTKPPSPASRHAIPTWDRGGLCGSTWIP
jgi:Calcineurin-like phosphoesterase